MSGGDRGQLYIYEAIGVDWWTGGGITGDSVRQALDAMKGAKALDVFINSEGGDVFEAKAIYTQLKRFTGEKVIHIDGIAASAASFIAMAGDKVISEPVATWMIHEAWSMAAGRAADMRAMADVLDLENGTLAETYAKQTDLSVAKLREMMAAETWMNAQEALDLGFCDEIAADPAAKDTAAASADLPVLGLAAQTQERIKTLSTARQLAARANRTPGQPGNQRPASR